MSNKPGKKGILSWHFDTNLLTRLLAGLVLGTSPASSSARISPGWLPSETCW